MTTAARPWYFDPRVIITAGCLVAVISFGVRSTFGLFTKPISDFHLWSRESFGFAMAVQNLIWGMMQPVAGGFADRYGAARVLIAGALLYALGVLLMSFAHTPFWMLMAGGVLTGAGIATASFSIVMAGFGRLVPPEKRSWAYGVATAASSLGQCLFAPLGQGFIAAFGWQSALVLLAISLLMIIPLALPMSAPASQRPAAIGPQPSMLETIRAAFGHTSYVLLVAGFFVCGFQIAFVTIHAPAFLVENGVSTWLAAGFILIVGGFNVIGSYSSGIIGGKYSKRIPLSIIYLLRSVLITGFILLPVTPLTTVIFAAGLGLLWLSTVPLTMGLVAVMFGTRYMATLFGFVFLSHQVGAFFGVWLGGKLHDSYGSYDPVWWISVGLGLFAALIHIPIRETKALAFSA